MKTKQLLAGLFFFASMITANAQATESTNAIASTSYVGTSNNFDVVFKRQAVAAGLLSLTKTSFGVNSLSMANSVSFGVNAGQFSYGTGYNTYVGQQAGKGTNTVSNSGYSNTFIGYSSGEYNKTGYSNTFIGVNSGYANQTGYNNVFIGENSGGNNNSGNNNVFIGKNAGSEFAQGNNNCFIGSDAGLEAVGSNNVFIGANAGLSVQANNKLIIDIYDTVAPLIWGDFAEKHLKLNAKVGIGYDFGNYPTTAGTIDVSSYNLFVKGGILTEEVRVNLQSGWADYVFAKEYKLPTLEEVETFIAKNGHLPNVPSAKQVQEDGIELGEMAKVQQEKIEELTLYIIEQNKVNAKQDQEIQELKQLVELLIRKN